MKRAQVPNSLVEEFRKPPRVTSRFGCNDEHSVTKELQCEVVEEMTLSYTGGTGKRNRRTSSNYGSYLLKPIVSNDIGFSHWIERFR